jgi:diacylglycerol kinase
MIRLLRSFGYAFNGVVTFFRNDSNGQIQGLVAIVVVIMGFVFKVSVAEWLIISICCGAVISLEMINSAIEKLCDMINPDPDPRIKMIKDVAAGGVVVMALASLVIGLIIFIPKIF